MSNGRTARAAVMGMAAGCGGGSDAGSTGKPATNGSPGRSVTGTSSPGAAAKPGASAHPLPVGTPAARGGTGSRNGSRLVNQREIDSYVLGPKDVPGYTIETFAGRTTVGTEMPVALITGNLPRVSPAACQHLYENAEKGSAYRQYARADDVISGHGNAVQVTLVAYRPADARKVLSDLRAELPHCTSFAMPRHPTDRFEHPRLLPDSHLGDDSVEYGITEKLSDQEGTVRAPYHYLVVRKGSVIAWYQVLNIPGKAATLPMDVINAQLARLP